MRNSWFALAAVFLAFQARAETVGAPRFAAGDSWTHQETTEKRSEWHQTQLETTVLRVEGDSLAVSNKAVGSSMPAGEQLVGTDWSRIRNVNGRQTVVNRPFSFPLNTGKSWVVEYTEEHPNRQHSNEHFRTTFKVVGSEDVTVPAGTFHAIKIEGEGEWQAAIAPAVSSVAGSRVDAQGAMTVMQTGRTAPGTVSGRMYKAFWYVPAVKRWVKSEEDYYDTNGARNERYTDELASYRVPG